MKLVYILNLLGVAVFAVSGALAAGRKSLDLLGVVVVVMGVITGVAGGVMRDVLAAEIPLILRPGELYATAAITGTVVYLLLETAGMTRPLPTLLGVATIALLRFASIIWRIKLPVFTVTDPPEG